MASPRRALDKLEKTMGVNTGELLLPYPESSRLARAPGRRKPAMTRNGEPLVSFVVPSYQMGPYLELGLTSLRSLRDDFGAGFEIVVVDDGSSDGTPERIEAAKPRTPGLRSVRRERDARSCRSLARNTGVRESRGSFIVFLDAGVLVKPDLLNALVRAWSRTDSRADVLLIGTLGLFGWQARKDFAALRARFDGLTPSALATTIDALEHEPTWCDRRRPLFTFADNDLSRLPAPWLLAWTSALGVPRWLFEAVDGFDETFLRWGCEDCDFARRMHRIGASFRAFTESLVLHVPHPTEPWTVRKGYHLENARPLHEKCFERETEMFAVTGDPFAVNLLAMRLDRAALPQLLPCWDDEMARAARGVVGATDDVLVLGAPQPVMLSAFERAAWAVPSRALIDDVTRATRNGGARCNLGCALEEPPGGRDLVVLTDLLRLLPADLQRAQLREALRVGKSAYLLCSGRSAGWPDGASVRRDIEGFPLLPIERLHEAASQAGVALTELPGTGPALRAYALSSNATHGSAGVLGSNG